MENLILYEKDTPSGIYNIFSPEEIKHAPPWLSFLTQSTIENIWESLPSADIHNDNIDLIDVWKNILSEAIFFLRINDIREQAYFFKTNKSTPTDCELNDSIVDSNVYGISDISGYFNQFADFEKTLYGVDKYYRDHFLHPLRVWVIGLNILKHYHSFFELRVAEKSQVLSTPHSDEEWYKRRKKNDNIIRISAAELSAIWSVIALTHDLGYPLEKVEKVNDQLEKMLSQFGKIGFARSRFSFENQHDHLIKFLLDLVSSITGIVKPDKWKVRKRAKYFTKFAKSWEMFDHGIVSSLILLKALTFFIETDYFYYEGKELDKRDATQFAIRAEILHAIASHTTPKIYHLYANNLPFLLVFCDDIQEWERPTISELRSGKQGSANRVEIIKFDRDKHGKFIIDFKITYGLIDWDEQLSLARRLFKSWLERLRPALDDDKRNLLFRIELVFGDSKPWVLKFDPSLSVTNPFKLWTASRPTKESKRSDEPFDVYGKN